MSQLNNKWIADGAVTASKIDFGTGADQVKASLLPIEDAGNFINGTNIETALQEICGKYVANWVPITGFAASGGSSDVDTQVKAAAVTETARTSFTAGLGVFVDASGDYGAAGGSLPATGTQITELGLPGYVAVRNASTKDPVDDGANNEVYGVLFYNTNNSKYYVKYFSDVADVQTAYSFGSSTNVDLYFGEIYSLNSMPAEGFLRGGFGGLDVVTGDITAVSAGDGLTGGGTAGAVQLDVGAGDGIDVTANSVAVDVTDFIDTTAGLKEDGSNNIQVSLAASAGLEFVSGALGVNTGDLYDSNFGLTESANKMQIHLGPAGSNYGLSFIGNPGGVLGVAITAAMGLQFNGTSGAMEVKTSDIVDVNYGLSVASNQVRVNLDAAGGLEFNSGAIRVKADGIKDTMIDFGTGAGQVSADDIPDGSTNVMVTATQETNWDSHLSNTSNPHSTTYSQVGAIQDANDTVKKSHIDWGPGANQVTAADMPIADAGGIITATNVEAALQELAGNTTANIMKQEILTLTAGDISNGYKVLSAVARGAVSESKPWTQMCPSGGFPQEYITDFTACNNDAGTALILIWKSSGAVTGLASPTYPTSGLVSMLEAGDKLMVVYE